MLFIDSNGALRTIYWSTTVPQWTLGSLTSVGQFPAGATVSAVARSWDKLDVFMSKANHELWNASWFNGAGNWSFTQLPN